MTTYSYAQPVRFGEHRLLFRPRDSHDQHLLSSAISISPDADIHWIHDVFGNCITIAEFAEPATELRFETDIVLDHTPQMVPRFQTEERAKVWPFEYDQQFLPDLVAYVRPHHPTPEVEAFARRFIHPGETETGHLLLTMTAGIRESFSYSRRTDRGTQPPAQTLALRRGTCRDFALLMIECCRSLGLAARFVTGYLYVPARDTGSALRGGGATHAWVQVFLPGAGWVEFDPTNGIIGSKNLIRVGVAREPAQARPLSGSFIGDPKHYLGMTVEVSVTTDGARQKEQAEAMAKARRLRDASTAGPRQ